MDFNTSIEHYKNGTATEEERLLVEDEIEKYILLGSLVQEESTIPESPEIRETPDFRKVRRRLRRRSAFQITVSILLTLVLLLGIVHIGVPAAESLYWQPEDSSFGAESSDLLAVADTYARLFCPRISIASVKGTHTGFASYDLELEYFSDKEYPQFTYGYGSLQKGQLSIPNGFWPTVAGNRLSSHPLDEFNRSLYTERLSMLPEYMRVGVFISLSEDITMDELLSFKWELVQNNPDRLLFQTEYHWTAIRCYEDNDENYPLIHCGLGSGGYTSLRELNLTYPNFDGTQYPGDMSQGISVDSPALARIYENQFVSQLSFMRDMCQEGRGIGELCFYENALSYIEDNGIQVYGCFIVCSPQRLLEIMEMEEVSGIYIEDIWL